MDISVYEKNTDNAITFPLVPDKIEFQSGGVKFVSYDIMDIGEIKDAIGSNPFTVSWEGRFPGKANRNLPWLKTKWHWPEWYQVNLSHWKKFHTPLELIISDSPIFHNVLLVDYRVTYKEGVGDFFYYIEFTEDRKVTFTISADNESGQELEEARNYLKNIMNRKTDIPINAWKKEALKLAAEKFDLCDEFYRLKDAIKNVETLRRGAENIMKEHEPQQRTLAQGMDL